MKKVILAVMAVVAVCGRGHAGQAIGQLYSYGPGLGAAAPLAAPVEDLRAAAAADPARFIDERTPAEVSAAFGLPLQADLPDRAMIGNGAALLAGARITVDLTSQTLKLESPELTRTFRISSGLPPSNTTPGSGKCFKPDAIKPMHYSSLYNNAPMPNTIFFNGNIAIHATSAEDKLGQPASHGCIRTSKQDSKTIYDVVKAHGREDTSICVTGKTPVK